MRTPTVLVFLLASLGIAGEKPRLDQHHVFGPVRVFYTLSGDSAVPGDDEDGSGTPDRVENVARQAHAAYLLFCESLEFPDPMQSDRYPGVNCFQVSLLSKKILKGQNGVAYRMAQGARPVPEGKKGDRALVMAVANTVDPTRNLTPAHEMFHLIQYGTTHFGNSWYLEGMARWSEKALGKGDLGRAAVIGPKTRWPHDSDTLTRLFAMKYEAGFLLWNPLAKLTDRSGKIEAEVISPALREMRYTDGEPVMHDHLLRGAPVMREILLELSKQDEVKQSEHHPDSWTLDQQNSPDNDRYIYESVLNVLRKYSVPVEPFIR